MFSGQDFYEPKFLHPLIPRETLNVTDQCLVLVLLVSSSAVFLLLLSFGPCFFNFLVKFVSSRIQQINLQIVIRLEYPPANTQTMLEQAAISFCGLSPPSVNAPWQKVGTGTQDPTMSLLSLKKPEWSLPHSPVTCVPTAWDKDKVGRQVVMSRVRPKFGP